LFQAARIAAERGTDLFEFQNLGLKLFLLFSFEADHLKAQMSTINSGSQVIEPIRDSFQVAG